MFLIRKSIYFDCVLLSYSLSCWQNDKLPNKNIFDYFASFIQALDFYVKEIRPHISLLIFGNTIETAVTLQSKNAYMEGSGSATIK